EFSLGVTQLLDDLLGKEAREGEDASPKRETEEAMRRSFQKAQEFCEEAQKYMDLVAQEEAEARRETDLKRKKAERRWEMSETADSQMFFSCDGFEAMRVENEARLQQVHQGIVDVMQSHGKQVPVDQAASPFAQTIDFKSSLGCTFIDQEDDASPILDFERLLERCEKMQAELERWGDVHGTPRGV
ncbi:unnamed protein product, partial [Symbiodinium necroappetens]